MALLAIASAKGSPGATTLALVVAALWPRPVILADCDPAGGDVAVRMPGAGGAALDDRLGLVSLAAVGRHGLRPDQIVAHTQPIAGGLDVLAGVSTPEQAAAVGGLWGDLGPSLDAVPGVDVVADCGRLGSGYPGAARGSMAGVGPMTPVLAAARLVVLVCRPDLSSVVHLRERIDVLGPLLRPHTVEGVPMAVVVVARPDDRKGPAEVREVLARDYPPIRFAGQVAYDEHGAAFFNGTAARRIDRTMLVRTARDVAASLADALTPFFTPAAQPPRTGPRPGGAPPAGPPYSTPPYAALPHATPPHATLPHSGGPPAGPYAGPVAAQQLPPPGDYPPRHRPHRNGGTTANSADARGRVERLGRGPVGELLPPPPTPPPPPGEPIPGESIFGESIPGESIPDGPPGDRWWTTSPDSPDSPDSPGWPGAEARR